MQPASQCPECGSTLTPYWPKGLCARCALDGMLERPAKDVVSTTLVGQYELLEEVARGGMGVVYRARQVNLGRIVALKMILAGQFAAKEEVLRFRGEAEAAGHLQHPNIVRIHETGEHDGHHYFSMDFVQGRTLTDIMREGPLPAQRAAKYAARIAGAIHYAHSQGVLHRDLKPSNIIIDANDEPHITDFGLAKRMRSDFGVTITGQLLGTPNFMPPEQTAAKREKVGPPSDVYGVGAILYYLLTGRPPFHADTIEELLLSLRDSDPVSPRLLNPSVPRDLETICLKCLEKDPSRRYATAQALTDELHRFILNEPIQARPLLPTGKLWRWCQRRPTVAALSAGVLLLLVAVAITSTVAALRVNRARNSEHQANLHLRDTVSLLELQRAENFFRNGDAGMGVAHLTAMLRRDPSNHVTASRFLSALVHRDWAVRLPAATHHADRIETLSFSPDGRHILSASRDHTARISEAASGASVAVLQHSNQVFSAHYDPTGSRIVTASADGTARIWEAASGDPHGSVLRHKDKVFWAEFSSDGRTIVTASADRTARIWDANGVFKQELRKHSTEVVRAHFSPDGKQVVTGGYWCSIRLWNAESGEMLFRVEDRSSPLTGLGFSPDGRRLVAVSQDGTARLWDLATRTEVELLGTTDPIDSAVFSPDGRFILMGSHHGTTSFWDVNTGLPIGAPLRHEGSVVSAEFSLDGRKIVTVAKGHSAQVWNGRTRLPLCPPIREPGDFTAAKLSPDGKRLVTAGDDGSIHVWDLRPRRFAGLQTQFENEVTSVSFSSDGKTLVASSLDGTARVVDSGTSETIIRLQHPTALDFGEFNPDGNRIFTAATNGQVQLWDWRKGVSIAGPFHSTRLVSARFSPDGERLVTGAVDGMARVWNAQTWEPLTPVLRNGSTSVFKPCFSPDGRLIITAGGERAVSLLDAKTGKAVLPPLVHQNDVRGVHFSPDGKKIVTTSRTETAFIWDLSTGQLASSPLQHTRIIETALFSPDGRRVITASPDRTVQIWDVKTGSALTPPLKHDLSLVDARFTIDGELAMTGCWNGATRVWHSKTGQPVTEFLETEGLIWRFVGFDPNGRCVATGGKDATLRVWPIPSSPTPVPEWFLTLAESVAGIRVGARGQTELVPAAEYDTAVRDLRSSDRDVYYTRLARWFLADPADREPLPF